MVPVQGLGQLQPLIDAVRSTGADVTLTNLCTDCVDMTNAVKHAGPPQPS